MVRAIRPATDWRHLRALKEHLRAVRPDVVHTHSSKAGVLGRAASLATGIGARVHTPHTFAFLFSAMFSPAKRALFRRIEVHYGRRTDRVVAVSESEAETIRGAGVVDPSRVRVVPNGIDPEPWNLDAPVERSALGLPPDVPLVVVAGLFNSAKGQDVAIEALAQPGLAELHLALAGIGDGRVELEALARRVGVAERTHFLGWRDDLPALFGAVDAVLVPSRWEGLPYVVLEAQARGVPVVGTRVDGVRELVREGSTGFLAEVGSPPDVARALRALLDLTPAERRRLGAAGRALVASEYHVDRMVERLIEVYTEVA
jgi:glycosyltransferase involved in cell wall biosynthesis